MQIPGLEENTSFLQKTTERQLNVTLESFSQQIMKIGLKLLGIKQTREENMKSTKTVRTGEDSYQDSKKTHFFLKIPA